MPPAGRLFVYILLKLGSFTMTSPVRHCDLSLTWGNGWVHTSALPHEMKRAGCTGRHRGMVARGQSQRARNLADPNVSAQIAREYEQVVAPP